MWIAHEEDDEGQVQKSYLGRMGEMGKIFVLKNDQKKLATKGNKSKLCQSKSNTKTHFIILSIVMELEN